MIKRTQLIGGVCAVCVLIALVVFLATRNKPLASNTSQTTNNNQPGKSDTMRRSLQAAVAAAKKGDRGALSSSLRWFDQGNVQLPDELLPEFTSFLGDADAQVQVLGARGLYVLGNPKSKKPLIKFLQSIDRETFKREPTDEGERHKLEWQLEAIMFVAGALGKVGDDSAIPALGAVKNVPAFLEHSDPIIDTLAKLGAVKVFASVRSDADEMEITRAGSGIRKIRDPNKVPDLMAVVRDGKVAGYVRAGALEALGEIDSPKVPEFLVAVAADSSFPIGGRCVALLSAGKTHAPTVEKPLLDLANDPNSVMRAHALTGLVLYRPQEYFSRWFDTIMDTREKPELRVGLPDLGFSSLGNLIGGQKEHLYRCLEAKDPQGRPNDDIRTKIWVLINEVLKEQPPIVLSNESYVFRIRSAIETRLGGPTPEVKKEVEEKVRQLVTISSDEIGGI